MDEMVQDVMAMGDEDEIEEEADAEVDKILFDMTDGLLGQAGQVGEELKVSYNFVLQLGDTYMYV